MVRSSLSASVQAPTVDVIVDLGHPLLNYSVDGLVKVGGVRILFHHSHLRIREWPLGRDETMHIILLPISWTIRWFLNEMDVVECVVHPKKRRLQKC